MYGATLEQLDHVSEQHQPVGPGDRVEQRLERVRLAQHVPPQPSPDVEVRHDEGTHLRHVG
jgi:hypothetical protein